MKKWLILALLAPALATAQRYETSDGKIRVAPVKMPYSGARNVPELSGGPDYLDEGGVVQLIEEAGGTVKPIPTVKLTEEENKDYGEWHRLGLANAHLGDIVAANEREGYLTVGLLANCSSLSGILGGLQSSGPSRRPLKIGLVFIDAHGDINTPETTLSGMLGGMPVAVAAGMCLRNLRLESGLDIPLPERYIVMGAVATRIRSSKSSSTAAKSSTSRPTTFAIARKRSTPRWSAYPRSSTRSTSISTWTFSTRRKLPATRSRSQTVRRAWSSPEPSPRCSATRKRPPSGSPRHRGAIGIAVDSRAKPHTTSSKARFKESKRGKTSHIQAAQRQSLTSLFEERGEGRWNRPAITEMLPNLRFDSLARSVISDG